MELRGILSGQLKRITGLTSFCYLRMSTVTICCLLLIYPSDCKAEYDPRILFSGSCLGQNEILKGHEAQHHVSSLGSCHLYGYRYECKCQGFYSRLCGSLGHCSSAVCKLTSTKPLISDYWVTSHVIVLLGWIQPFYIIRLVLELQTWFVFGWFISKHPWLV